MRLARHAHQLEVRAAWGIVQVPPYNGPPRRISLWWRTEPGAFVTLHLPTARAERGRGTAPLHKEDAHGDYA